ncbi:MAG: stage II sporulation protein M [Flavobacteriaceae bacterium]|nr:stage II sporulation protein M [Flavobacteriaceae bacterium]MDG2246984.1 stage II sporulation protein M [Flavobacteriales bacterium]
MRETDFIGQNKEKWVEFEKILHSEKKDAEKLSRLFIESTDDLSFSRTYYPNRSVRVYLNGLAQQVYQTLYRNRKKDKGAFKRFWTQELPDAMWYARKQLLVSFLVFVLGVGIGLLSSAYNPDFVEIILGERYVEMTENNIKNGDPMAVYGQTSHLEMFLMITWNNIRVSFLCFLMGLLFSIGSGFIVFTNAIMVGAFLYFFIQRSLFWESFYAIMLHGTLELSMIVLAGAAGIALGKGLLFPGSYSRLQSFLLSARHGINIMIGVSAFLVIAGFIEGFATRYTDAPNVIRGTVILLSLTLVVGYFVVYPFRRAALGLTKPEIDKETINEAQEKLLFEKIKKTGQIINESWRTFTKSLTGPLVGSAFVATIFTAFLFWFLGETYLEFYDPFLFSSGLGGELESLADGFWFWDDANNYFDYWSYFILFPLTTLALIPILIIGSNSFKRFAPASSGKNNFGITLLNALITAALMSCCFFASYGAIIVIPFIWPLLILSYAAAELENDFFFMGMSSAFKSLKGNLGKTWGLFLAQGLVLWSIMAITSTPLFYLIFDIIGTNFAASIPWVDKLIYILHTWVILFSLGALFPTMIHSFSLLHFSNQEIANATELKKRIKSISFKKRAYGLEKEI